MTTYTVANLGGMVLRRIEAHVTVMDAPDRCTVSLALLVGADPKLLTVVGDRLHIGEDLHTGEQVTYRVTGWQPDPPCLIVERVREATS